MLSIKINTYMYASVGYLDEHFLTIYIYIYLMEGFVTSLIMRLMPNYVKNNIMNILSGNGLDQL